MKCNFRKGNKTFNFTTIMPEQHYNDTRGEAGVLRVMALAHIELGWKPRGEFLSEAVDLLQFAVARIGEMAIGTKQGSGRMGN